MELPGWWTYLPAGRGTCLDSIGRGQRSSGFLPRLALCTLYHTTVIMSIALYWVLCHSSELSILREVGTPKFVAMWPEVWVVWGPDVSLVSEMKALLWRAESVTCGECQNWAAIHPFRGEAGHGPMWEVRKLKSKPFAPLPQQHSDPAVAWREYLQLKKVPLNAANEKVASF